MCAGDESGEEWEAEGLKLMGKGRSGSSGSGDYVYGYRNERERGGT
jgi:hypothetical protein